jgi:hypothetical protein
MNKIRNLSLFVCLAAVPAAFGQRWEVGGAAGGSFYTSQTVTSPAGSADATFERGFTGTGYLTHNTGDRWGGEIRYDFTMGAAKLSGNGTSASLDSQAHAFQYHIHYNFAPAEAAFRPFVAFGGGMKMFRGVGSPQVFQPLGKIALLTPTSQMTGVVAFGGGVKVRVNRTIALRMAVYDFMSPFPSEVIAPALGAKVGGWLHNLTPMVGVSALF